MVTLPVYIHSHGKDRISGVLSKPCKCREGTCFESFKLHEVKSFLDHFQKLEKREQDAVLFLACQDASTGNRREYHFLGRHVKRACFEQVLGISSHRTDRVGHIDMRYGPRATKPSELTASIDTFCMVLYNSIAEPLPNK